MNVALGADHAGYELKDAIKGVLDALGASYHDFGTGSADSVDYPDFAHLVADAVSTGRFDRGILVCGSGIGMAIAANKVPGVRASVITDVNGARLAREHNDLNVLTIGARVTPADTAAEIVRTFLATDFANGRHALRVGKIHQIERGRADT